MLHYASINFREWAKNAFLRTQTFGNIFIFTLRKHRTQKEKSH